MTEGERWAWHSEVYAFRRVVLGVSPDEKTSPPDPEGKFFDEHLVREAARRLVKKRNRGREAVARVRGADLQREGRGLLNEWAQARGYADIDGYAAAKHGGDWFEAYKASHAAMMAASQAAKKRPRSSTAADLGVTAREYTPEQMADGRRALGLEPPEAAA